MDILSCYLSSYHAGLVDLSSSSPPTPDARLRYQRPGGLPALRAAVADRYPGLTGDDVIITNGASEALAAIALALTSAGDRIGAAAGTYPSFTETAARAGAFLCDATDPDIRLLVVTQPSLPGGQVVDIAALAAEAHRRGIRLVADEVYRELATDPAPPAATLSPNAISVADLSKPLGLGGLRIGWAATRDHDALEAISRQVQLLSGGPSVLAMEAALEAMRGYDDHVQSLVAAARDNGEHLFAILDRHGWTYSRPEAGATFAARPPRPLQPNDFDRLREHGLFLVPGEACGLPGAVRISLFAPPQSLERALRILERPQRALVVLAKAPVGGLSKTRLAAAIGVESAESVARAFLADTVSLAYRDACNTVVSFAPANARSFFEALAPHAALHPQPDGDLGHRIRAALDDALRTASSAALIGADTPDLPLPIIEQAFAALGSHDLAIAPADDGGFVLMATGHPLPEALFAGVEWSTPRVLDQVLASAARLGLSVALTDPWADVDDATSLHALERRLATHNRAPNTRWAVAALTEQVRHGA